MIQILQLLHSIQLLVLTVVAMQILLPSTAGRVKVVYDTGHKSRGITASVFALKKGQASCHPGASGSNTPNGRADLGEVFCVPGLGKRWWGLSQQEEMKIRSLQSCTPIRTHIFHHSSQGHPSGSPRQLWPVLQHPGSKQHFWGERRSHWTRGGTAHYRCLWRRHTGNEQQ